MISSKHRFHGQNDLRFVYRRGKTIRTKYCQLKYTINPRREDYRASVVVSKKVAKNATVRNRIRRRMYEQVRLIAPKYLKNHDVVITVYDQGLAIYDSKELEVLVSRLLKSL